MLQGYIDAKIFTSHFRSRRLSSRMPRTYLTDINKEKEKNTIEARIRPLTKPHTPMQATTPPTIITTTRDWIISRLVISCHGLLGGINGAGIKFDAA